MSAVLPARPGFRERLRAYVAIGRIRFRTVLVYRSDFVIALIVLLLQIFALRVLWTAVYDGRESVSGNGGAGSISLSTQIAYATLAALQFWLFNSWAASPIPPRIREGKIAIDLSRPIGLLQQGISGSVGATVALLPFALLALPFALLVGGAAAPASPVALVGYIVATVIAYAIATLLTTLTAMIAFWTLETSGFMLSYRVFAQFFAGALVPLWFMPDWMRAVAEVLPFQATTYAPVAIYLGQIDGTAVWTTIGSQLVWVLVLWVLLRLVWARALRRVVVQGG